MRIPDGFLICEYSTICSGATRSEQVIRPFYEEDYVDELIDDAQQICGDGWEVYTIIVWVDPSEVTFVGYLDSPTVAG